MKKFSGWKNIKTALVYDRVNKYGGAERVLEAIHEIWPNAPLYTSVYHPSRAVWAKVFKVIPSMLQHLPFAKGYHELLPALTPFTFESFSFDDYDLVISISSAEAKGIITKPSTCHICYCLTPTRYLWSAYYDYLNVPGLGIFDPLIKNIFKLLSPNLRRWDYISSRRPDGLLAISKAVAERINKYYGLDVAVVYPPVDTNKFKPGKPNTVGNYFLIVSRLVPNKKIDYPIRTFNKLGRRLIIIGKGIDSKRLKKIANKNIIFIDGDLTDKKLCWYYENCLALILPGEEDFGLNALEVQACGKPVIALNRGGAKETVLPDITGILYDQGDSKHLISAIKKFDKMLFSSKLCRQNALRYNYSKFKLKFKQAVDEIYQRYNKQL